MTIRTLPLDTYTVSSQKDDIAFYQLKKFSELSHATDSFFIVTTYRNGLTCCLDTNKVISNGTFMLNTLLYRTVLVDYKPEQVLFFLGNEVVPMTTKIDPHAFEMVKRLFKNTTMLKENVARVVRNYDKEKHADKLQKRAEKEQRGRKKRKDLENDTTRNNELLNNSSSLEGDFIATSTESQFIPRNNVKTSKRSLLKRVEIKNIFTFFAHRKLK